MHKVGRLESIVGRVEWEGGREGQRDRGTEGEMERGREGGARNCK